MLNLKTLFFFLFLENLFYFEIIFSYKNYLWQMVFIELFRIYNKNFCNKFKKGRKIWLSYS